MKKYCIFKLILFFTLSGSILQANMGAILLIPKDAKLMIGIYSGISKTTSTTYIRSTNDDTDGQSFSFANNTAFTGIMIGLLNNYYRLSLTYDEDDDSNLKSKRALMNFDFMIGKKEGLRPMFGFGVGAARISYHIDGKNIEQGDGIIASRVGIQYSINSSNAFELILEYSSLITDDIGVSFEDANHFSRYNIKDKNDILLRVGYSFEF